MSTTVPAKSVLIGDLLVKSEMTTPLNMADAVPISLKTNLPIGRVLIGHGKLSEQHLQQALLAQSLIRDSLLSMDLAIQALRIVAKEGFTLDQALAIAGWHPDAFTYENRLGLMLVQAGIITTEELEECLRVFYSAGLPLARVLVLKKKVTNLVAYVALTSQQLLRENKLTREQAIQAVQAAKASRGVIEQTYVDGYLRLQPANTIRLGELLVRAQLIAEEALITTVEYSINNGQTLGEVLVERGLITEATLQRALETQRLVTAELLDIDSSSEVLRKAEYDRISVKAAMAQVAPDRPLPPELQKERRNAQHSHTTGTEHNFYTTNPSEPSSPLPFAFGEHDTEPHLGSAQISESKFDPEANSKSNSESALQSKDPKLVKLPANATTEPETAAHGSGVYAARRSYEEARVREVITRLDAKLDALNTRNDYLENTLDTQLPRPKLFETNVALSEGVSSFDASMEIIEKLFGLVENSAYRNGYLLSKVDTATINATLLEKMGYLETVLAATQKRLESTDRKWQDSDELLRNTLEKLKEAEHKLAESASRQHPSPSEKPTTQDGVSVLIEQLARQISGNSTATTTALSLNVNTPRDPRATLTNLALPSSTSTNHPATEKDLSDILGRTDRGSQTNSRLKRNRKSR